MALKIKRRRVPLDEKQIRRRRFILISMFVCAGLFFAGFSIGRKSTDAEVAKAKESTTNTAVLPSVETNSQVSSVGPSNFELIVPRGFKHTKEGAKKAAATYVESYTDLIFSDDASVINALNAITNPSAVELRKAMSDTILQARTFLADAIAGRAYHQSVPMQMKVDSYDSKSATITVWSLELWSGAGTLEPQANFNNHKMKLVYVNNDWKIDSWVTEPGASPTWVYNDQPLDSLSFTSEMSKYEEYRR